MAVAYMQGDICGWISAILMQCIGSVMQFGMNMILRSFTETAVAVMGVYGRLQSFIFMPVFGLNQGVLPILGFNYGAGNRERLMDTYKGFSHSLHDYGAGTHRVSGLLISASQHIQRTGQSGYVRHRCAGTQSDKPLLYPAAYGIMTSSVFQATATDF